MVRPEGNLKPGGKQAARKERDKSGVDSRISRESATLNGALAGESVRLDGRINSEAERLDSEIAAARVYTDSAMQTVTQRGPLDAPSSYPTTPYNMPASAADGFPAGGRLFSMGGGAAAQHQTLLPANQAMPYTRRALDANTWTDFLQASSVAYVDSRVNSRLPLAGGTMSGTLDMGNNVLGNLIAPTAGGHATRKLYVDAADALNLPLAGGTMSGNLGMGANLIQGLASPVAGGDATRKAYVDSGDALRLPLAGGTLSGNLGMGNNKIVSVGSPTSNDHAVNLEYMDVHTDFSLSPTVGVTAGSWVDFSHSRGANPIMIAQAFSGNFWTDGARYSCWSEEINASTVRVFNGGSSGRSVRIFVRRA